MSYQILKNTYEKIKRGQSPTKRPIHEMDLVEALAAEKKYLLWAEKNPNHPDFEVKKHIYTTYLIPRLQKLQRQANETIADAQLQIDLKQTVLGLPDASHPYWMRVAGSKKQ